MTSGIHTNNHAGYMLVTLVSDELQYYMIIPSNKEAQLAERLN